MAVTKAMKERTHYLRINGEEIPYYKIDSSINGCPRYVIHFVHLGIKLADYGKIKGLTKYKAKWFGGGYVIESYALEQDIQYYLKEVEKYYERKGN